MRLIGLKVHPAIAGVVVLVACGRTEALNSPATIDESIPRWHADLQLTIGLQPGPDDDFTIPVVFGVDSAQSIYVVDHALWEVRRFAADGKFLNLVTRRGEAPGEMRGVANVIELEGHAVRYVEMQRGLIQWLAPDGAPIRSLDTGITASRFGFTTLTILDSFGDGDYLLAATQRVDQAGSIRPGERRFFLRAAPDREELDTLYFYDQPGRTLVLDGGQTRASYPGPAEGPIVFYSAEKNGMLRIDRPWPESDREALISLKWFDGHGRLIRQRDLTVAPVSFSRTARDSARARVLNAARLSGRRSLDAEMTRAVTELTTWPDYLPAIDMAVMGSDGSLWLRQPALSGDDPQDWLVLDSLFVPVARVTLPSSTSSLSLLGQAIWASLSTPEGEPFVARLQIRK